MAAEAEWGSTATFVDSIADWAARHGHPLTVIDTPDPQAVAAPSAQLQRRWHGPTATARLLVSNFIQLDPWSVRRIGAVNFWTVFGVQRCVAAAQRYVADHGPFERVDATPFDHGVTSPRAATYDQWHELVTSGDRPGELLGHRRTRWPADFASLARAGRDLSRLPDGPPWSPLPVERLEGLGT